MIVHFSAHGDWAIELELLNDKLDEMSISATALTTLNQAAEQVDRAAEGVRRATLPEREAGDDRVDLSTAAVRLLSARTAFEAGIVLARTADEIERASLDLLG